MVHSLFLVKLIQFLVGATCLIDRQNGGLYPRAADFES
jgi:hypothetical protein